MMFFKLINHNLKAKKREVYLVGLYEDQATKWENCLDPSDEIKAYDRTYKLIKDKLLRAMIEHQAKLRDVQNTQGYYDEDNNLELEDEFYDNWNDKSYNDLQDESVELEEPGGFPKMKDAVRRRTKSRH